MKATIRESVNLSMSMDEAKKALAELQGFNDKEEFPALIGLKSVLDAVAGGKVDHSLQSS